MFHFYGGVPVGSSMAVYEGRAIDYYMDERVQQHGELFGLSAVAKGQASMDSGR